MTRSARLDAPVNDDRLASREILTAVATIGLSVALVFLAQVLR